MPRVSLNSNTSWMSSTCFFQDPFTGSRFSLAITEPGNPICQRTIKFGRLLQSAFQTATITECCFFYFPIFTMFSLSLFPLCLGDARRPYLSPWWVKGVRPVAALTRCLNNQLYVNWPRCPLRCHVRRGSLSDLKFRRWSQSSSLYRRLLWTPLSYTLMVLNVKWSGSVGYTSPLSRATTWPVASALALQPLSTAHC